MHDRHVDHTTSRLAIACTHFAHTCGGHAACKTHQYSHNTSVGHTQTLPRAGLTYACHDWKKPALFPSCLCPCIGAVLLPWLAPPLIPRGPTGPSSASLGYSFALVCPWYCVNAPVFPLCAVGAAADSIKLVADGCCTVAGTLFELEVPLMVLLVAAAAAAPAVQGAAGCLRQKRPLEAAGAVAVAVVGAALGLPAKAGDE